MTCAPLVRQPVRLGRSRASAMACVRCPSLLPPPADDEGERLDGMDAAPPSTPPPCPLECELKFECQMYKVRDDEYMIDLQVRAHVRGGWAASGVRGCCSFFWAWARQGRAGMGRGAQVG